MEFLEKLNYLMDKRGLNKNTLSKDCNIPYTTIDGWYKKGYEGLKLTTLKKLSGYFGVTLDFLAYDDLPVERKSVLYQEAKSKLETMNDDQLKVILKFFHWLEEVDRDKRSQIQ